MDVIAARIAAIEANGDKIAFAQNNCCGGLDYRILRADGATALTLVSGACGGYNPDPAHDYWFSYDAFDAADVTECLDSLGWDTPAVWALVGERWERRPA